MRLPLLYQRTPLNIPYTYHQPQEDLLESKMVAPYTEKSAADYAPEPEDSGRAGMSCFSFPLPFSLSLHAWKDVR